MSIKQKQTKLVVKTESGLVELLPETSIDSVSGLQDELSRIQNEASGAVHTTGTETISGTKTFTSEITGSVSGNAGTADAFSSAKSVALTGDVTGSHSSTGGWSVATTLANSGVTAGTYTSVTVDAKGRVTAGTNPSTLGGYGINDANIANGTITLGSGSITPLTAASNLDASKLTGTVPISSLPSGALERLVAVQNQTARFALTSSDVQLGDTVKQVDTGILYYVVDTDHLDSAAGYEEYAAGSAASVPWGGITGKPSEFAPSAHSHSGTEVTLTGYSKPQSTSAVASSDTANSAVGKLEAALDGKADDSGVVHTTGAETVDGVKSFSKNTTTTAIALSGSEVDVSLGSFFTKTISADTTFTFVNAPSGKTCIFSLVLTNGGAYNITWPVSVSWIGGQSPSLKSSGIDILTFLTVNGGTNWMEVSSGGGAGGSIADTGVVAGSYGPSANVAGTYGGNFVVPQITVNQKGQITQVLEKTITIPASDNTDISVQVVENGWTKSYVLGVDAANQISGVGMNVTAIADKEVYLTGSPGTLHASSFDGPLNGTALKATNDVDNNPIKTTYAKLASPAFTGTPTAPTAASGTNTTQIATTAFVQDAVSSESVAALSGTAIDLSSGRTFTKTVSANTAFTITNAPSGKMTVFTLGLTNAGSYTITWPNSVSWNGGVEPTLAESGISILTFTTLDGGTHWYAGMTFSEE